MKNIIYFTVLALIGLVVHLEAQSINVNVSCGYNGNRAQPLEETGGISGKARITWGTRGPGGKGDISFNLKRGIVRRTVKVRGNDRKSLVTLNVKFDGIGGISEDGKSFGIQQSESGEGDAPAEGIAVITYRDSSYKRIRIDGPIRAEISGTTRFGVLNIDGSLNGFEIPDQYDAQGLSCVIWDGNRTKR